MIDIIPQKPDLRLRKALAEATEADFNMCWTCSSCDGECPVNIATGRLRPQKIVHLAYLGFMDELLSLPEIWYCLTCRRCNNVCPNRVKPADLISHIRRELAVRGRVSLEAVQRYRELFTRFQRVRWHAAAACIEGDLTSLSDDQWNEWMATPVKGPADPIKLDHAYQRRMAPGMEKTHPGACFTCSECSNACPIFCERGLFDPQMIIRLFNLGREEELLHSPAIWLCLSCRRCTDACSQMVKVHEIILRLRETAVNQNKVDPMYPFRLQDAEKITYARFHDETDAVFTMAPALAGPAGSSSCPI